MSRPFPDDSPKMSEKWIALAGAEVELGDQMLGDVGRTTVALLETVRDRMLVLESLRSLRAPFLRREGISMSVGRRRSAGLNGGKRCSARSLSVALTPIVEAPGVRDGEERKIV